MRLDASRAALIAIAGSVAIASLAQAQTADDYNRAAQAIRVCSSGAAAMIPECAQVRARFGLPSVSAQAALGAGPFSAAPAPAAPVLPGLGGGKAGAVAGLLGMAMSAAAKSQAPPAAAPVSAVPSAAANMSLDALNGPPPRR